MNRNIKYFLAVLIITNLLFFQLNTLNSNAVPIVQSDGSYIYTMSSDFDNAKVKDGVIANNGELKIDFDSAKVTSTTTQISDPSLMPYLWIPNTDKGSVSEIDVKTGDVIHTFKVGEDPSRLAIDKEGNCWVACRDGGELWKLDRTNNTSKKIDSYGKGNHEGDNGPLPRAVDIDKDGNVWVGMYGESKYICYNYKTEKKIKEEKFGYTNPYGCTIDKYNILWSVDSGGGIISRYDITDDKHLSDIKLGHEAYSITSDKNDRLYITGFESNEMTCLNLKTGGKIWSKKIPYQAKGVVVDAEGNVWVAGYTQNVLIKLDASNGKILTTFKNIPAASGVSIDKYGYVWVIGETMWAGDKGNVMKLDPKTQKATYFKYTGKHYTYSDLTGSTVDNLETVTSTWGDSVQSKFGVNSNWDSISWNASVPSGTTLEVSARTANAEANLKFKGWVTISSGASLLKNAAIKGEFLEIQVKMTAPLNGATPKLFDLTIKPNQVIIPPPVPVGIKVDSSDNIFEGEKTNFYAIAPIPVPISTDSAIQEIKPFYCPNPDDGIINGSTISIPQNVPADVIVPSGFQMVGAKQIDGTTMGISDLNWTYNGISSTAKFIVNKLIVSVQSITSNPNIKIKKNTTGNVNTEVITLKNKTVKVNAIVETPQIASLSNLTYEIRDALTGKITTKGIEINPVDSKKLGNVTDGTIVANWEITGLEEGSFYFEVTVNNEPNTMRRCLIRVLAKDVN